MSQAISIVKPGLPQTSPAQTPQSTSNQRSKLNAINAQPFIPTNPTRSNTPQPQQQQQQQPAGYGHHHFGVEYDYSGGVNLSQLQPSYYLAQPLSTSTKLDHHLYQHHQPPNQSNQPTFFLNPNLHLSLSSQIEAIEASPSLAEAGVPNSINQYTGLVKLDSPQKSTATTTNDSNSSNTNDNSSFGGYRSVLYKGWSRTGECVALRRIVGLRVTSDKQIIAADSWTRLKHPGLVHFHEAFTTRDFGDYSVVFVYDFHPLATTIYHAHLSPLASLPPNPWSTNTQNNAINTNSNSNGQLRTRSNPTNPTGLSERVIWSYLIQLSSAIKTIHHSGLAVRNLEPNRVIISSKNRIRIAGCGIMDVINYDLSGSGHYQQDDLLGLGKLMIAIGCGSAGAVHNLPKSVDQISRAYSPELKNVILYLLSKPNPRKTIDEVLALAGPRVLDELNSSLVAEDKQEAILLRQVENGRLVRLLSKFGFINERPE